jgi:hypothetical protein
MGFNVHVSAIPLSANLLALKTFKPNKADN